MIRTNFFLFACIFLISCCFTFAAETQEETDNSSDRITADSVQSEDNLSEGLDEIMSEPEVLAEDNLPEAMDPAIYSETLKGIFPLKLNPTKDPSPQDSRSFSEIANDEYWFIKESLSLAKDDDSRKAALIAVESWINSFGDSDHCDDVLLAKAELHIGLGDRRRALISLMKHRQTYPDSLLKDVVREKLSQTAKKHFKKKQDVIMQLADAEGEGKISRLSRLYSGLAEQLGEELYEPLLAEFKELISAAPTYAYRDRLLFSMAQLYHVRGAYDEASLLYSQIIRVYPESTIIPVSKLSLAEINAREKRNYAEAIRIYEEIALKYEGMDEAFKAYKELPRLLERQKQYEEAVNVYEKIIALYPERQEAKEAYRAEISVLRYELKRYADAISVTKRMADKYKDNRTKNDLYSAVEIARANLKNLEAELEIYEIIATNYADAKNAPAALLSAAQACERARQTEKAKGYYQRVIDAWPGTAQAKKAEKALSAMKQN